MSQLKQAAVIISSAWQRNLNYRVTVLMYRVGEIVEVLVLILMWTAIYSSGTGLIKGFSLSEMITYVLIGTLCATATRNFLPSFVSRDISEGRLSMFLVKPISYIRYVFLNEFGRSFLSTILSIGSQLIVLVFFLKVLVGVQSMLHLLVIIPMVLFAQVIEMLIGFLIGAIAFWTDEVDGIQATLERVKRFFSGGYFPLALLPAGLIFTSSLLPFQYSFFAPAMLWLGKMSIADGILGLGIQLLWIIVLAGIVHLVWKAGLRRYEAIGS